MNYFKSSPMFDSIEVVRELKGMKTAEQGVITFHIRKRMTPRGGNSFYRDKSERKTETFCGAPVTGYDIRWNERGAVWNRSDFERFEPCAECLKVRAK